MRIRNLNRWDLSPREAAAVQRGLAPMVRGGALPELRSVLGLDVSYSRARGAFRASAVLLDFPSMEVSRTWTREGDSPFPYVPGLLSFREIPPLLPLLEEAPRPDLILVDGQGIAHPRGLGLASHIGLLTQVPTIGCAKSLLVGEHGDLPLEAGSAVPLTLSGRTVGFVLRSRTGCRPLYVSPGHLLTPEAALEGVTLCLRGYRLPEPTRLADRESRKKG